MQVAGGFARRLAVGTAGVADQRATGQAALDFQPTARVGDALHIAQVAGEGGGTLRALVRAQVARPARTVGKTGGVATFADFGGLVEAAVLNGPARGVAHHAAVGVVRVCCAVAGFTQRVGACALVALGTIAVAAHFRRLSSS